MNHPIKSNLLICTIEINEVFEVEFTAYALWVDNGIGSYEYWGQVGHHSQWEWEIEEIEWDKKKYTPEQNQSIDSYVADSFESIAEKLYKKIN